jgi:hypothetical protein
LYLQFFIGSSSVALFTVAQVLLLELTTGKYATWFSNVYLYFAVAGELLVLAMAYFYKNWHTMNMFLAAYYSVIAVLVCMVLPESPRYLISAGKTSKALALLQKIARLNGTNTADMLLKDTIDIENILKEVRRDQTEQKSNEFSGELNKLSYLWKPKENLMKTLCFTFGLS